MERNHNSHRTMIVVTPGSAREECLCGRVETGKISTLIQNRKFRRRLDDAIVSVVKADLARFAR